MPQILIGETLENMVTEDSNMSPRYLLPKLMAYLNNPPAGRVGVLFGLRRTGKTVMISHALREIGPEKRKQSAYILAGKGEHVCDIYDKINELRKQCKLKYVFIDETTDLDDFTDYANWFSDLLGKQGIHVVLTGTNSLGFKIAKGEALYDRANFVHTTWIPYGEHSTLLNTSSIDDYIESGGILPQNRRSLLRQYPLEAIVPNILNTLKNYEAGGRFDSLAPLNENGVLGDAIQNVIKHDNHLFAADVIRNSFSMKEYLYAVRSIPDKKTRKLINIIDIHEVLEKCADRLQISGNKLLEKLSSAQIYEINSYLLHLELVHPKLEVVEGALLPKTPEKMGDLFAYLNADEKDASAKGKWILKQPGLRWAQVKVLLEELRAEFNAKREFILPKFDTPDAYVLALDTIFDTIKNNIRGKILEEIVILETALCLKDKYVFGYKPVLGDIDVVIASKDRTDFELLEVKNSTEPSSEYGRHIAKKENLQILGSVFGSLTGRRILYRGNDVEAYGCQYQNVANYLKALPRPDIPLEVETKKFLSGSEEEDDDEDGPSPLP